MGSFGDGGCVDSLNRFLDALPSLVASWEYEQRLFERVLYKNKNGHRRMLFFRYLLLVQRHLRRIDFAQLRKQCRSLCSQGVDSLDAINLDQTAQQFQLVLHSVVKTNMLMLGLLGQSYFMPLTLSALSSTCRFYAIAKSILHELVKAHLYATAFNAAATPSLLPRLMEMSLASGKEGLWLAADAISPLFKYTLTTSLSDKEQFSLVHNLSILLTNPKALPTFTSHVGIEPSTNAREEKVPTKELSQLLLTVQVELKRFTVLPNVSVQRSLRIDGGEDTAATSVAVPAAGGSMEKKSKAAAAVHAATVHAQKRKEQQKQKVFTPKTEKKIDSHLSSLGILGGDDDDDEDENDEDDDKVGGVVNTTPSSRMLVGAAAADDDDDFVTFASSSSSSGSEDESLNNGSFRNASKSEPSSAVASKARDVGSAVVKRMRTEDPSTVSSSLFAISIASVATPAPARPAPTVAATKVKLKTRDDGGGGHSKRKREETSVISSGVVDLQTFGQGSSSAAVKKKKLKKTSSLGLAGSGPGGPPVGMRPNSGSLAAPTGTTVKAADGGDGLFHVRLPSSTGVVGPVQISTQKQKKFKATATPLLLADAPMHQPSVGSGTVRDGAQQAVQGRQRQHPQPQPRRSLQQEQVFNPLRVLSKRPKATVDPAMATANAPAKKKSSFLDAIFSKLG